MSSLPKEDETFSKMKNMFSPNPEDLTGRKFGRKNVEDLLIGSFMDCWTEDT